MSSALGNVKRDSLKTTIKNGRLETWRQALEAYGFRLSRSKTEYMECNFSKRRRMSTLEVKVGDHIIP